MSKGTAYPGDLRKLSLILVIVAFLICITFVNAASIKTPDLKTASQGDFHTVPLPIKTVDESTLFNGTKIIPPPEEYSDLRVNSYSAEISSDLTLDEQFNFQVYQGDTYRSLTRVFDAPLTTESLPIPHISYVSGSVAEGAIPYLKDSQGEVFYRKGGVLDEINAIISKNAKNSEYGGYRGSYYPQGEYPLTLVTKIYPPIEYDEQFYHLNLDLASEHVPYDLVEISFPAKGVVELYPHPSNLTVKQDEDRYIITGKAGRNELLGIELLLTPEIGKKLPGFPTYVPGVREKTVSVGSDDGNSPGDP